VGGLDLGLLGLEFLAPTTQPLQPRPTVSEPRRQLVTSRAAVLGVLGGVDSGCLFEHLIDFFTDRRGAAIGFKGRVGRHRGPVRRDHADRHQSRPRAQRQHLRERARQRVLMTRPQPRDGRVIRNLVGADHPCQNVLPAAPLDHPRGPLGQIELADHLDDQPHQTILIKPLAKPRQQQQQQQHLLAGHTPGSSAASPKSPPRPRHNKAHLRGLCATGPTAGLSSIAGAAFEPATFGL